MRAAGAVLATLATLTLVATGVVPAAAQPPGAVSPDVAPGTTALFRMDEAPGATVDGRQRPRPPRRHRPRGVQTGVVQEGATAYNWVRRPPEQYPASPERIVQVPDHIDLEPGDGPFTIQVRYRTKESFGNITQKGQANSRGGQWKIQSPQGIPSCLFQGADGQVPPEPRRRSTTTRSRPRPRAHLHRRDDVVVGEQRNRKNGVTGTIDNDIPLHRRQDELRPARSPATTSRARSTTCVSARPPTSPPPPRSPGLLGAHVRLRPRRLDRPGRLPHPLPVEPRRRRDLHRAARAARLRHTGHVHRAAHGHRQPGRDRHDHPHRRRRRPGAGEPCAQHGVERRRRQQQDRRAWPSRRLPRWATGWSCC